jgi:hypothetical protein
MTRMGTDRTLKARETHQCNPWFVRRILLDEGW